MASLDKIRKQFDTANISEISANLAWLTTETLDDVEFVIYLYCHKAYNGIVEEVKFYHVLAFMFLNGFEDIAFKIIKENSDRLCFGYYTCRLVIDNKIMPITSSFSKN